MKTFLFILFIGILASRGLLLADDEPVSQLVVMHSKGENWPADGNVSFDDPRIQQHGKYWSSQSIVEKGGPMPGTGGGMMLLKPGTNQDVAQKIASDDPAVKSKLLKAEVRQWLLFIDHTRSLASKTKAEK
jgi:hypothetical protein